MRAAESPFIPQENVGKQQGTFQCAACYDTGWVDLGQGAQRCPCGAAERNERVMAEEQQAAHTITVLFSDEFDPSIGFFRVVHVPQGLKLVVYDATECASSPKETYENMDDRAAWTDTLKRLDAQDAINALEQ